MIRSGLLVFLASFLAFQSLAQSPRRIVLPDGYDQLPTESKKLLLKDSLDYYKLSSPFFDNDMEIGFGHLYLEVAEQDSDFAAIAKVSGMLAHNYMFRGLMVQGKEFAMKAHNVTRLHGEPREQVGPLFQLANAESQMGNFDAAKKMAYEAMAIAENFPEDQGGGLPRALLIIKSYNLIGEMHRRAGEYEEAIEYYEKSLNASPLIVEKDSMFPKVLYLNIGLTYIAKGDMEEGLKYLQSQPVLTLIEARSGPYFEWAEAMTEYYENNREWGKGLAHVKEALAKTDDFPKWKQRFMDDASIFLEKLGRPGEALVYLEQSRELEREYTGETVNRQLAVMGIQQQLSDARSENSLLMAQSRNQQIRLWGLVIICSLILLGSFLLMRSIRRTNRINSLLNQKNQRLDEYLAEKEMWMNLMAHDLKAPLHSILGLTSMLENEDLPDEVRNKSLEHIQNSAVRGTNLISQLLEIAHLEKQDFEVNRSVFNGNDLFKEVVDSFAPAAEQKEMEIVVDFPEKDIEINSDPGLVQRILENFLGNAIKYSPNGHPIKVGIDAKKGNPSFYVEDRGPGLSEEDQEQLFQKFVRLSPKPTGGESSTGLGLAIVKALAEKIGGEIQVESQLGDGSTFALELSTQ